MFFRDAKVVEGREKRHTINTVGFAIMSENEETVSLESHAASQPNEGK